MKTIDPDPSRLPDVLASLPADTPIIMLNLLRFRDRAHYPAGMSDCTGREAYGRYSAVAQAKVAQVGGTLVYRGDIAGVLIGPQEEDWDEALLVRYPSAQAFADMLGMSDYRAATVHRTAALEDSRLIATVEH